MTNWSLLRLFFANVPFSRVITLIHITTGFNNFQSYGLLKKKLYLICREIYYVTTVDRNFKNINEKLDLANVLIYIRQIIYIRVCPKI